MAVNLIIVLPEGNEPREKSLHFRVFSQVSELVTQLVSKYVVASEKTNGDSAAEDAWGLFSSKRGLWLQPAQTLAFYNLGELERLELKPRRVTLRVVLADSTIKTIKIDRLQPVSAIIQGIAEKLRLDGLGPTYGLRAATSAVSKKSDDSSSKSELDTTNSWLRLNSSLDEQGISGDEISFGKRFFDLTPSEDAEINATDEHLTFFEARSRFLSGHWDSVIPPALLAELAAILLIHQVGRVTKNISSTIQDNISKILSAKSAKKAKGTLTSKIGSLYESFSPQSWASDPRAIKRRFFDSIAKVTQFASVSFNVDTAKCGDTEFANVLVVISAQSFQIVNLKSPRSEKGLEALFSVSLARISTHTPAKGSISITVDASSRQPLNIFLKSDESTDISDTITGFLKTRNSGSRTLRKHPSVAEPNGHVQEPSQEVNLSSVATAIKSGIQLLDKMRTTLSNNVNLVDDRDEASTNSDETSGQSMTISQWFSQAGTHLSSLARLAATLMKQIRTTNFSTLDDSQKLTNAIATFCSVALSVGRCITKSMVHNASSQQTICFMTQNLLKMCVGIVDSASYGLEEESNYDLALKADISAAERVFPVACNILDMALRGQLADEASSMAMFLCCRDIKAACDEITTETSRFMTAAAADLQPDSIDAVQSEAIRNRAVFSWYSYLFLIASSVAVQKEKEVLNVLNDCIDSVGTTASALLSCILERNSECTDSQAGLSECVARIKWSWGSLDQSLKIFASLARSSQLPTGAIDPMLPPVLHLLIKSTDDVIYSFANLSSTRKSSHLVERVTQSITAVTNTLKRLDSLEPSESINARADRLESALDKLRSIWLSNSPKLGRSSSRTPTVSRRTAASTTLFVLDTALAPLCENRAESAIDKPRLDARVLVTNILLLRSTLRLAGSSSCDLSKHLDVNYVRTTLEQLDVLVHEVIPQITAFLDGSTGSCSNETFTEWSTLFGSIVRRDDPELSKFGFFAGTLKYQLRRLAACFDICAGNQISTSPTAFQSPSRDYLSPAKDSTSTSSTSELSVRRGRRKSLIISSASILNSSSQEVLSSPSSSLSSSLALSSSSELAVFDRDAEGSIEFVNEAALLYSVSNLIKLGESKDLGISFKDALEVCLTTFPYWTNAESIAAAIVTPFVGEETAGLSENELVNVGTRVSVALSKLLRLHPNVVKDPPSRMTINSAITAFKLTGASLERAVQAVEDTIRDSLDSISRLEKIVTEQRAVGESSSENKIDLLTVDLQQLANQLSIVEQKFFDAVSIPDLINSAWTKQNNAVAAWVAHSNAISQWVASRILTTPKRRDRARLIGRLIKLAEILRDMSNFSGMISIFLSLSMESIARLRKTWESNGGNLISIFGKLSEEIKPLQNFSGYREKLKKANSPCIPYCGLIMRDTIMLEEALSQSAPANTTLGATYAFTHLEGITKVFQTQIFAFRKAHFTVDVDPSIYYEVLNPLAFDILDERELINVSVKLEQEKVKSPKTAVPPIEMGGMKRTGSGFSLSLDVVARSFSEYGVRSALTASPRTPSSPSSPSSESPGFSTSSASPSNDWKRNVALSAAACETASSTLFASNKDKAGQLALDIADSLSSMCGKSIARTDSTSSLSRSESTSSVSADDERNSISTFLRLAHYILTAMPELKCAWETSKAPDEAKGLNLSRETITSILSVSIQAIMICARQLKSDATRFPAVVTTATSLSQSSSLLLTFTIHIPKDVEVELAALQSSVASLLAPGSVRQYSLYHGKISLDKTLNSKHAALGLSFLIPAKPSK